MIWPSGKEELNQKLLFISVFDLEVHNNTVQPGKP